MRMISWGRAPFFIVWESLLTFPYNKKDPPGGIWDFYMPKVSLKASRFLKIDYLPCLIWHIAGRSGREKQVIC